MGFSESVPRNPTYESEVIVGVIGTGIWPESESFIDEGFGPPPKKWKGTCKGGKNLLATSNSFFSKSKLFYIRTYIKHHVEFYSKIIGARYYNSYYNSLTPKMNLQGTHPHCLHSSWKQHSKC
ncbi:hypothetical protein HYC85_023309 [Camellia sinensis]|uniref:Peptidase S8/S53 domain-containing protein n=1 Tax=Camellia sinensis TaxID=4442 RepID=A0A7J7GE88_CAMSI|nr:hypothetical protein HYC85_023309 [Camellia sinensis]